VQALRQTLDDFLRHFLMAVQVSTRVPVQGSLAGWVGTTPGMQRAGAPHLPGVGWLVGMAACVAFAVLELGLPDGPVTPLAAAVGCIVATVAITGALHEKSLAAFIGSPGLTLALMGKASLLGVLAYRSPGALATALLAAHTVSRFWPLVLAHTLPPAGEFATDDDRIDSRSVVIGAVWCAVPLALMLLAHGLLFVFMAVAVSGLALLATRFWVRQRLRGFTPDALGTAQQVTEVAFYLGAGFGLSSR
jgi:adenosylcobinamide-GDP ribazoletransferase